jgi:hypothetical protein
MENRDDEGGQGPPDNPNPSGGQKRTENDRHREGQGDKESARPSPSGVPNEGRGRDIQAGRQGLRRYAFQGQGKIPNSDNPDDHESAGSTCGTADKPSEDDETCNPA